MRTIRVPLLLVLALVLFSSTVVAAKAKSKLSMPRLETILAQNQTAKQLLTTLLPDSLGYRVTRAVDPTYTGPAETAQLYQTPLVVCPDLLAMQRAARTLKDCKEIKIKKLRHDLDKARSIDPAGYRGMIVRFTWQDQELIAQIVTFQQLRWLLWARPILASNPKTEPKANRKYGIAVSDYLDAIDRGESPTNEPKASAFGLAGELALYPTLKSDSIRLPKEWAEISTDFTHCVTAFAPTDSMLAVYSQLAPQQAFGRTDPALFQWQCREFFATGRSTRDIARLSAAGFSELENGEYAFAVGIDGEVRFVHANVTGNGLWSQLPHTLLFPLDSILTSGAFVIERNNVPRMARVNIRSDIFFYDKPPGVDMREQSDRFLTTLGHFFQALRSARHSLSQCSDPQILSRCFFSSCSVSRLTK